MDNERLIEQLNQAVDLLLANAALAPAASDAELAGLLEVATELRALPRIEFKEQLKRDLENAMKTATAKTEPTKSSVNPVREGFRTVTPYIAVRQVYQVIDFVKEVFGAEGNVYGTGSEGGIHSEYRIGDSIVMIGGGEKWRGEEKPGSFHIYVENVDEVYERAVKAGATALHPPVDQEYGERC